ncbi:hypothetical protein EVAR_99436_1 [Eumeta japonica]|uniref:Uncharacterized protein n=1 Tax=Eumeta variegata TaxID=151549 RepID=A0A4C1ZFC6_EUMVA|nr:hypothetical protein EVAR_99436_1 [Eumeta japonica]
MIDRMAWELHSLFGAILSFERPRGGRGGDVAAGAGAPLMSPARSEAALSARLHSDAKTSSPHRPPALRVVKSNIDILYYNPFRIASLLP